MIYGTRPAEIVDFNQWLGEQPHRFKVVIAGNHDLLFERQPGFARSLLTNAIYLQDSGVELQGLQFWGSPVQPPFNNWAFNVERGEPIRRHWEMIPEGTDVLITHGPPMRILDRTDQKSAHLGCEELLKVVEQRPPKLHVFGHIHGGYGRLQAGNGTQFVNASVLNEEYSLVNAPQAVDIEL